VSNDTPEVPFFSRWSRQKREGDKPESKRTSPTAKPPTVGEAEIDPTTLPKIEDLTAESDISCFLRKGVPEALQKLALRRMWALDPEIRNFVEVAENQFDFHAAGGIYGLFEELPAGSDMSIWLAQATQSVAREAPKDPAEDAPVENSKKLAAAQQAAPEVAGEDGAGDTRSDALVNAGDGEPHEVQQPEAAKRSSADATGVTRRRHGGALPA
jgi:Protein of unknown function (DUF3306)